MLKQSLSSVLLVSSIFVLSPLAATADDKGMHGDRHAEVHHDHAMNASGDAPHWSKTLTAEQKKAVDKMHDDLDTTLAPLKENEKRKQEELNKLTIQDGVDMATINKAIDDLMAIKNQILRHRHAHLVEMRRILNAEQRASYDAAVLTRDKIQ